MLGKIFYYELSFWLRTPLTFLCAGAFLIGAVLMTLGNGGFFDGVPASTEGVLLLNTPFGLSYMGFFWVKILLFIVPIFVGNSLYRDYSCNMHAILYSYPIPKWEFLLAKLGSGLCLVIGMGIIIALGSGFGEFILGQENPKIGGGNLRSYFIAWGIFILPTLCFVSLLVFATVGISRNIFAGFVLVIVLFLIQVLVENIFFNHTFLLGLLDPFGQNSFILATQDWGLSAKNSLALPIDFHIGYNRVLWAGISVIAFLSYFIPFDFEYHGWSGKILPVKTRRKEMNHSRPFSLPLRGVDSIQPDFSALGKLRSFLFLVWYEYRSILRSWLFILLALGGILCALFIELRITQTGNYVLYPVTRIWLSAPFSLFTLIILAATFLFGGILVQKASQTRMFELIDSSPTENGGLWGPKLLALTLMQLSLLIVFMCCGVVVQFILGKVFIEWSIYLFFLFILQFPLLLCWAVASIWIHTLSRNIFLGFSLLFLLWLSGDILGQVGISSWGLTFNQAPRLEYSDWYGFHSQLPGHFLVVKYWLSLAMLLGLFSLLFWRRGMPKSLKERVVEAIERMSRPLIGVFVMGLILFVYHGNSLLNAENTSKEPKHIRGDTFDQFKRKWAVYGKIPLPKIQQVDLTIHVFPEKQYFEAEGEYLIRNRGAKPIDTLLIRTGFDEETELTLDRGAKLLDQDRKMKYSAYFLKDPLLQGDSMRLFFKINSIPNAIFSRNSSVLRNGTFLKHDILPRFTFQFESEDDTSTRSNRTAYHYFSKDADLVSLRTTISTHTDQLAIAPGVPIKKYQTGDRNFYTYETRHPVKFNFSFHSGIFATKRDTFQGVPIEIHAHPTHSYTLGEMLQGLKASISYNTSRFGKDNCKPIRIIEFPHTEGSYSATLMGNNIPTSEMLFIMNTKAMQQRLNLPFYVMAHELTHRWFGNKAIPARGPGAKMLTESLTEYISLMIYRDRYGEEYARKFLDIQERRYNRGRVREIGEHSPLTKVREEQEYIAYGKGSLIFHKLAHLLGKDLLNQVLKTYLMQYLSENYCYPTATDFVKLLEQEVDSSFYKVISEGLESTILYDNQLVGVERIPEGKVEVSFTLKKIDEVSQANISILNELIEIGQVDKEGELLTIDQHRVSGNEHKVRLELHPKSQKIVLDPNYLLLDRNRKNNSKNL
ncbi:MAG: M1 family aminopeptidase [Bacteroidota bacterium]